MITRRFLMAGGALGVMAAVGLRMGRTAAQEQAHVVVPPTIDETRGQSTSEIAVVAGGCFWGVQGVFQHVQGVTNAVSGYTGGEKSTAEYEIVSSGATGHAESVRITYDPQTISYGRLLQIFFSVAHDPTQLNRQGPDYGTQYRSAIFPVDAEQARIAKAYIDQLDQAHAFPAAIVTKIEPGRTFYPAEAYHQDFLTRHPNHPYIVFNDLPKIDELRRLFPDRYRAEPVLVATAGVSN
jgi:peptide-methionine (S)-S-oxide reductase